jgi:hypothetical protein
MWKFIIAVPLIMLLTGCKDGTESNSAGRYNVECIDGVEYLSLLGGYLSPRVDAETLTFIRCEN